MRICLVASAGGHMVQLLRLIGNWNRYDTSCVTTSSTCREKLRKYGRVYVVGECNREHPLRVILVLLQCVNVVLRERPDVVISTGAAAGCMVCYLAKIASARVVWVDSITNVEKLSLSGRMVRHIADLFLVQWLGLAERYSDVEYVGPVI